MASWFSNQNQPTNKDNSKAPEPDIRSDEAVNPIINGTIIYKGFTEKDPTKEIEIIYKGKMHNGELNDDKGLIEFPDRAFIGLVVDNAPIKTKGIYFTKPPTDGSWKDFDIADLPSIEQQLDKADIPTFVFKGDEDIENMLRRNNPVLNPDTGCKLYGVYRLKDRYDQEFVGDFYGGCANGFGKFSRINERTKEIKEQFVGMFVNGHFKKGKSIYTTDNMPLTSWGLFYKGSKYLIDDGPSEVHFPKYDLVYKGLIVNRLLDTKEDKTNPGSTFMLTKSKELKIDDMTIVVPTNCPLTKEPLSYTCTDGVFKKITYTLKVKVKQNEVTVWVDTIKEILFSDGYKFTGEMVFSDTSKLLSLTGTFDLPDVYNNRLSIIEKWGPTQLRLYLLIKYPHFPDSFAEKSKSRALTGAEFLKILKIDVNPDPSHTLRIVNPHSIESLMYDLGIHSPIHQTQLMEFLR